MQIITDIRNALSFICRGEFKEVIFRLRVYFSSVDFSYASIQTLGLSAEKSHDYRHSGGVHLERVLNNLKITNEDAIVDFGAGKGGALVTFSKFPFSRVTGVELLPELAAIAEQNFKLLGIPNVSMVIADATEFLDLESYNYFYFYSPFPRNVMSAVITNITNSLSTNPRIVRLIYCNPEFADIIENNSPFCKTGMFHHHQLNLPIYIYSNQP